MKHFKSFCVDKKILYFFSAVVIMFASLFAIANFKAEEDNTPAHYKTISPNGDGTYNLSLDVTGDSNPEIETASNVNVVIVYDVSQSMSTNVPGTRNSRGDQAEKVVHDFIKDIASYQDQSNPNNIQMSLVTFAKTATVENGWTTSLNNILNKFDENGTDGRTHFNYNGLGTNWEQALYQANSLLDSADDDPTFVILVTDGAPTALGRNGDDSTSPSGKTAEQLRKYYAAALPYAKAIQGKDNTTLYGIYIYGDEVDLLDDLMHNSFVADGSERPIGGDTVEAQNYYNASNTPQLEEAIDEIFHHVVQAMGISSVTVSDGTTTSVKASSGTMHLLNVDETSYKYWLSMDLTPVSGQANTYRNSETGNIITFVGNEDSATGTWTDKKGEHSISGKIITVQDPKYPTDQNKTKTIFRMQWTNDGNELHKEAPTPAHLVTDADGKDSVDWDLSSHGVLLNGVTYTVTFDVWPTQYTYDLIADLENETVHYSDLHEGANSEYAGLDRYISKTLDGKYYLETNTNAMISYKDTRLENPITEYSSYTNPPDEELVADKIDIVKKWENYYDNEEGHPIQIIIKRETDGQKEQFHKKTLDFSNNYTDEDVSISTGLMRLNRETGEVEVLDKGHDYSFEEIDNLHYRWEFVAETVHPMIINGELHELVLLDEASTTAYANQDETEIYSIPEAMTDDDDYYNDGTYEYVRVGGKLYVITGATPTIKAFNYRRSNLNISKEVDGEAANPDEKFEFKVKIDDPGIDDDEFIWFSVFENEEVVMDDFNLSDDWTAEYIDGNPTGFYYAPKGTELVIDLKAGQKLSFPNLTTQCKYTIVESEKDNYVFNSANGVADYGSDHTPIDYVKDTDYEFDTRTKTITGSITMTNSTFNIKVLNTYELASIDVTKKWNDADNQDGKRPNQIEVQVYRQVGEDGNPETYGDPIIITKDNADSNDSNTWKYTIESDENFTLPRYDNDGNEYLYTVKETAVTDYETEYDPKDINQEDGKASYTIKNKHIPEEYNENGELDVTKIWDDSNNQDGLRKEVTVELYKNGKATGKTITLTTEDNSKKKFEDLPKYEDGKEIKYTIVETTTLEKYEDPKYDMSTPGSFTVTNKHTPEQYNENGELEVTKIWDDSNNQDGLRKEVTVELYKDGKPTGKTITLTTEDNSKKKFEDLPKYENGKEIKYTIVEKTTLEKYEDPKYDMSTPGSFTVTNKHTPEEYNENGELEVTKIWDDSNNQDGLRKEVTVELYKNGKPTGKTITLTTEDNSKKKFEDLPKYEDGKEIKYTIVEKTTLEKYEDPKYDMSTPGSFTVTNKHIPEEYNENGELEVTKIWDDSNNQDGLRKEVTVELYKDGKPTGKTITLTTEDNSKKKFEDLPKYEDGKEIKYTIVETTTLEKYEDPKYDMSTPGSFTVTNKHIPEEYNENGELEVTKIWDDSDNKDGLRKEVTVELYKNDKPTGKTITLTTEDNSKKKFEDLPKYEDGKEIKYTIVEKTTLEEYEDPKYDMSTPGSFTVTNKHEVVPVSIDVTKIWIDNVNQDGKRTDEITVKIYANGEFLRNETIKGDVKKDTWTYTINDLDRYKDGEEIEYTLEEVQVADYEEPDVSGNAEEGFTIKNTHNPSKITKTGTKTWNHGNNQFDHPESITVILHAKVGDEELYTKDQTVTEKDGKWEYSFNDLDEYKDGKIITYWVDEAPVTDYKTVIDEDGNITNTYSPEVFTINGTKAWDDSNNQDGKRPDHITVILHGKVNGDEIEEVKQEKDVYETDGKWEYKFEGVLKYAGGKEIEYSIEELPVDEYDEPIIHGTADEGFSITNHHTPETITYIVKKNWEDYNNADEIRPDSINVTLYKTVDGVRSEKQKFTISEANDWTYTFTDLPRYEGGKEITYDIVEDAIDGYAISYETNNDTIDDKKQVNTTITNSQTTDITIEKVWDDNNDSDHIRPGYINVNLFANGIYIGTYTVSKDENWKLIIKGLLKYRDGALITYTIEEETVNGYISTIDGFKITNTHQVTPPSNPVVEVMPPKTGVKENNNYLYLMFITLVGTYEIVSNKLKTYLYAKKESIN